MDTTRMQEKRFTLPPTQNLLRNCFDDKMNIDEPFETNEVNQDVKVCLPSMQTITSQSDDFARLRLTDLSSNPPIHDTLQHNLDSSLSYSRRGSVTTDPMAYQNYSRPSITELNNLPLPTHSAVVSRRGSIATTTDYDYSSRSPSPSPFNLTKKNDSLSYNRRDSLPGQYVLPVLSTNQKGYDPYQRRHSIAEPIHQNRNNNPKYKAFRFPATIQESPNYKTYSAPPSPPQLGHQEISHDQRKPSYRRPSILDDFGEDHLLMRRASMPVGPNQSKLHQELKNKRSNPMDESEEEEDEDGKKKDTPYSRSPELRISHKLAERKRRKEMKDLFDELRESLPVEKHIKTSKWEILSKAVEYITILKRRGFDMEHELTGLRREIEMVKREKGLQ